MEDDMTVTTVTLRVHRFTPRAVRARERDHGGSPFARRSSSPFGGDSPARRRPRGRQWVQDYVVPARPQDTVLDCLLAVKRDQDPSLAFRYSCGHGMCGSDAVAIHGTPTLLCTATVGDWARPADGGFRRTDGAEQPEAEGPVPEDGSLGVIELAPLPGFPVQRDLIADLDPMIRQIMRMKPYLQAGDPDLPAADSADGGCMERLQTPEQLERYERLTTCIACGVCEGACPVYAGGEAFVGPAALLWASRFVNDSRDAATRSRLDALDTEDGVSACQSVRACSRQCPQGIDVGEEMWQIVAKVRER